MKAKTLSLFNLIEIFPTKDSVIKYFENLLWKEKITCSKCKQDNKIKKQKDNLNYWCGSLDILSF